VRDPTPLPLARDASWTFTRNGTETSVDVRGGVHTNSGPGIFASVMAGLGIAMPTAVMCAAEVKAGSLVPLLRAYKLEPVNVHAVSPAARAHRQKFARWSIFWFRSSNRSSKVPRPQVRRRHPARPWGPRRRFLMSGW